MFFNIFYIFFQTESACVFSVLILFTNCLQFYYCKPRHNVVL
nr:MAG TPA: hypothetical protein [Caudoviricetes sp.]